MSVENKNWEYPSLDLLINTKKEDYNFEQIQSSIIIIRDTLRAFNYQGIIIEVSVGPSSTRYVVEVEDNDSIKEILNLKSELQMALAATNVELSNSKPKIVEIDVYKGERSFVSFLPAMKNLSEIDPYHKRKLVLTLGKNKLGKFVFADLKNAHHFLITGSTGSGKSVCVNNFIMSLIMRTTPEEVKLMLLDSTRVELAPYNGIPHLLLPTITSFNKSEAAIKKLNSILEKRLNILKGKNIDTYNSSADKKLPYIIVVIERVSNLIQKKDVHAEFTKLLKEGSQVGIHFIMTTESPSADVILPYIKDIDMAKISFDLSVEEDAVNMFGVSGAERLLNNGDMLFLPAGSKELVRIQGAFVADDEILNVVSFLRK